MYSVTQQAATLAATTKLQLGKLADEYQKRLGLASMLTADSHSSNLARPLPLKLTLREGILPSKSLARVESISCTRRPA